VVVAFKLSHLPGSDLPRERRKTNLKVEIGELISPFSKTFFSAKDALGNSLARLPTGIL
jgi:hypothetical protein